MSDQVEAGVTSRRALFVGVGMVGAASVLAACGDDGTPTADSTAGQTSGAAPSTGSSAAPVSSTPVAVGKITDVPVGGGKIYAEHGLVVTQPSANVFAGYSNLCTHMQCPLAEVSDGQIKCNCHFSAFSIANGSVMKESMPAKSPLPSKEIKVEGEEIFLVG